LLRVCPGRKPAHHLRYWFGPVNRTAGFRTILVYYLGPERLPNGYHSRCHHNDRLRLTELPDWDWYDISAHLKCTACGTVGWVDTRVYWSEAVDFNKGISR
jgi:hypothetical protein